MKETSNVIVVGYFALDDDMSAFQSVAETRQDSNLFAISNDDVLATSEGISVPGIALYKKFDERKSVFRGPFDDSHAIASFVKTAGTPLIVEFLPEVEERYVDAGLPLGYLFVASNEEKSLLTKMVEPLAMKYRDSIQFGVVDVEIYESLADDMHIQSKNWPAFAIREPLKNRRFLFDQGQKLEQEQLDTFVQKFLRNELTAFTKSEPVPERQESSVTVIVGKSYDDLVLNNENDVLVEFYTQWCGPCKVMAPAYEKLASLYLSNSVGGRVTIGKIDIEANDVPLNIRGVPTIMLFPADDKETPMTYTGPLTLEGMANFVKDNGKWKVDVLLGDKKAL